MGTHFIFKFFFNLDDGFLVKVLTKMKKLNDNSN